MTKRFTEDLPERPPASSDPERFFCPHCKAERPTYGFHYSAPQDMGLLGMMQWFTVYCEPCRGILSVNIMAWQPTQELKKMLLAQAQPTSGTPS